MSLFDQWQGRKTAAQSSFGLGGGRFFCDFCRRPGVDSRCGYLLVCQLLDLSVECVSHWGRNGMQTVHRISVAFQTADSWKLTCMSAIGNLHGIDGLIGRAPTLWTNGDSALTITDPSLNRDSVTGRAYSKNGYLVVRGEGPPANRLIFLPFGYVLAVFIGRLRLKFSQYSGLNTPVVGWYGDLR
jgi:hypothetical protein